jgi:AcrR family transcriptional regulator
VKVDLTRIRQAASALANRHGLDRLSMNDLARALRIRTPSLYSHVGGLGEVKRMLALYGLEELERQAAHATMGKAGPDAVRALLNGYRNFARSNPGVYAATLPTPPRADTEWRAAADRLMQTCLAALQGFGLQGAEATHALRGLRSLGHGFAFLEAAGALQGPVDRDRSFAWLIESFIAVLEKRQPRIKAKQPRSMKPA